MEIDDEPNRQACMSHRQPWPAELRVRQRLEALVCDRATRLQEMEDLS